MWNIAVKILVILQIFFLFFFLFYMPVIQDF